MQKIVLIGRVNAGKSTLFNRLSSTHKALVHESEGVTRDPVYGNCSWNGQDFMIVDTAGVYHASREKLYQEAFKKSIREVQEADILLLVIDGREHCSEYDYSFFESIKKYDKKVIVVLNKIEDGYESPIIHELPALGFETYVTVSAAHGRGIGELLTKITNYCSRKNPVNESSDADIKTTFKAILLGKPNTGKSSLMNILVKKDRSLVSPIPGTTREAIGDTLTFYGTTFDIVDTAGVRRSRSIHEELEEMMVGNTMQAIKRSDLVLLLIDVTAEEICDQDIKLAYYALTKIHKAVIVVWNKIDLLQIPFEDYRERAIRGYEHFFAKIDQVCISCTTQKNVGKIIPLIDKIWTRYSASYSSEEIKSLFVSQLTKTPLYHKTEKLIVKKAYVLQTAPLTIYLAVNEPLWFGDSQRAFFENILRRTYDLKSVPVVFVIRKR